jgi:hypothetical protein
VSNDSIISILLGGAAGAYVSSRFAIWRSREKLTQDILERAFAKTELIEDALNILHFEVDSDGFIPQDKNWKANFDKVIIAGDFLEFSARLYLSGRLTKKIIKDTNVLDMIEKFVFLLGKSGFKASAYNLRATTPQEVYLPKSWEDNWKYLYRYSIGNKRSFWQTFKALFF